ncbi:MAG: hypothetical protein EXR76_15755 [Myxococcales bacterium]|nr:hypothetical protein [Myxococcales bacterium]
MRVWLTATAERQYGQLSAAEQDRIGEAFDLLDDFPLVGKAYALDSPFAEKEARFFVVHVARQRAIRLTYRLLDERIVVLYVFPATYPLTHPEHLKLIRGK